MNCGTDFEVSIERGMTFKALAVVSPALPPYSGGLSDRDPPWTETPRQRPSL